jgi:hypothetical protein
MLAPYRYPCGFVGNSTIGWHSHGWLRLMAEDLADATNGRRQRWSTCHEQTQRYRFQYPALLPRNLARCCNLLGKDDKRGSMQERAARRGGVNCQDRPSPATPAAAVPHWPPATALNTERRPWSSHRGHDQKWAPNLHFCYSTFQLFSDELLSTCVSVCRAYLIYVLNFNVYNEFILYIIH